MQKEIIIKKSKKKLLFFTVLSLLFLIGGIHMLDNPETLSSKQYVSAIGGIILFPIAVLVFMYRLLFKMRIPLLIVNEEGYIYTAKYFPRWWQMKDIQYFVWWGQVKDIQLLTVHQYYGIQRFIEVELENLKTIPIDYTKENSKVVSYTQHSKKTSKYITMSFGVASGTYKTKKVIGILQQYKAEYDRINQIDNEPKSPKKNL